ncbi:MAG: radical SAM protein [Deltaproteobacteria bacterium]|nr:radical SAM protein [Deltaproteobacteria bacterium]
MAFFLTLRCLQNCAYCLVEQGRGRADGNAGPAMSPQDWLRAANRIPTRMDLPITLQGGEPALSPALPVLATQTAPQTKLDMLSTLPPQALDILLGMPPSRFIRQAPYAPIRVTFHAGNGSLDEFIKRVTALIDAGFQVGVYGLEYPDPALREEIAHAQERCLALGLDFRTKEFLGNWQDTLHGTYSYQDAVDASQTSSVSCRTSELLVAPDGFIHRCHSDLYSGSDPIGHILDPGFTGEELEEFRPCDQFGRCNPCDVKLKTNRRQIFGHTSVEIIFNA